MNQEQEHPTFLGYDGLWMFVGPDSNAFGNIYLLDGSSANGEDGEEHDVTLEGCNIITHNRIEDVEAEYLVRPSQDALVAALVELDELTAVTQVALDALQAKYDANLALKFMLEQVLDQVIEEDRPDHILSRHPMEFPRDLGGDLG